MELIWMEWNAVEEALIHRWCQAWSDLASPLVSTLWGVDSSLSVVTYKSLALNQNLIEKYFQIYCFAKFYWLTAIISTILSLIECDIVCVFYLLKLTDAGNTCSA